MSEIDFGATGRKDTFRYYTVNPFSLQEIEEFECAGSDNQITWDYEADTKVSASIFTQHEVDRRVLIRIKHQIEINDYSYTETLGTFFISSIHKTCKDGNEVNELTLYSTLLRFKEDYLNRDLYFTAGTNRLNALCAIIGEDGGLARARGITTTNTLEADYIFTLGDNKLDVLNQLCNKWWQLEVEPDGYIGIDSSDTTYVKEISYTFEDGFNCMYEPSVEIDDGAADVVNRVVAYYSTPDETRRAQRDLDDGYEFSYRNIGRHITEVISVNEIQHDWDLANQCKWYLSQHMGAVKRYTIKNVQVPSVHIGDSVRYINSLDPRVKIDCKCQVMSIDMKLKPGCPCTTTLKAVL